MGVQVKGSRGKGRRDRKDWKREREQEREKKEERKVKGKIKKEETTVTPLMLDEDKRMCTQAKMLVEGG